MRNAPPDEVDDDLLAAPADGLDPAAGHAADERVRVLVAQRPGPRDARAGDHRAGPAALGQQPAPEVARDGLDLGELRHRSDDRTRPAAVRCAAASGTSGTMGPSMTPSIDAARARRARIAVSTLFFAHGAIAAAVLPRLPAIKDSLGLTNAELGTAVAALPIGGLLAGGLAGLFIARIGSARVAVVSGIGAASSRSPRSGLRRRGRCSPLRTS